MWHEAGSLETAEWSETGRCGAQKDQKLKRPKVGVRRSGRRQRSETGIQMSTVENIEPIQALWVRGNLSRVERLSLRSFMAQGHSVHLYAYEEIGNVPDGVEIKDAREVVDECYVPSGEALVFGKGSYASFSDYFRLCLLHKLGGWWSDLDVVAIRPWTGFPDVVVASTWEQGYGQIANNFAMHFPAGHGVLQRCIDELPPEQLPEMNISQTGPLLLHRILGREGVAAHGQAPEVFAPVPWNAAWQLLRTRRERFTMAELKQRIRRPHLSVRFTPRTVAVHLWNEMWKKEGFDKNAKYDPSCLYEKLQAKYNPGG